MNVVVLMQLCCNLHLPLNKKYLHFWLIVEMTHWGGVLLNGTYAIENICCFIGLVKLN